MQCRSGRCKCWVSVPSQVRPDPKTKSAGGRVGGNLDVTESSKRERVTSVEKGTEKEAMNDGCLFFPCVEAQAPKARTLEPGRKLLFRNHRFLLGICHPRERHRQARITTDTDTGRSA